MPDNPELKAAAEAEKSAYDLILGDGAKVFDLSLESKELRDRYGRCTFGQDCLAARRLVESGVPYVCINYPGGWDTHSRNFEAMRRHAAAVRRGPGHAAAGPGRARPAGQHDRLVLRRVRPHAEDRLAAALGRRPRPLGQRVLRPGRRRRIQGRPRGRRLRRKGRRGQGAARLSGRPAGQHVRAAGHRHQRQAAASPGPGGPRVAHAPPRA